MARVRYLGPDAVTVPELGGRTVHPDEVVEVPDERFDGYVCQTATWQAVEDPRPQDEAPVAPLRKTAARPQKVEG